MLTLRASNGCCFVCAAAAELPLLSWPTQVSRLSRMGTPRSRRCWASCGTEDQTVHPRTASLHTSDDLLFSQSCIRHKAGPGMLIIASATPALTGGSSAAGTTIHPGIRGNVFLGHTRLAINDAEGGDQPFLDASDRALVANAEIYNFMKVLESLPTPPTCRSMSDCEAIIHAYSAWGIDCLHRLRGMFAFIIDDGGNSVYAARDPLGIKPLFYGTAANGDTWFASEVYAIADMCTEICSVPPRSLLACRRAPCLLQPCMGPSAYEIYQATCGGAWKPST